MGAVGVDGRLAGLLVASADGGDGRSSAAGGGGVAVLSEEVTRAAPKPGNAVSGNPGSAVSGSSGSALRKAGDGQGATGRAAASGAAAGAKADGPSRHTDRKAVEYFRDQWGAADKASSRIKDIRTVGRYLRIYTDLSETAENSSHAVTLCERGLAYLKAHGVKDPVVFVQARFGENGNPVLANILGPADRSCRVTHPAPN
jgi:hypothetical protein